VLPEEIGPPAEVLLAGHDLRLVLVVTVPRARCPEDLAARGERVDEPLDESGRDETVGVAVDERNRTADARHRLERLPPGTNPDNFVPRIRDLPR